MKILITGGAGFIGSNLVHYLIRETEHSVVNVDKLTYAGNPASLADIADHERYTFAQVDICDAEAVQRLFADHQPDAVMHLAAESHVDRSIDGPGAFIQTNVLGTFNLLQAAREYWEKRKVESGKGKGEIGKVESRKQKTETQFPNFNSPNFNSPNPNFPNFKFLHVSTDEVYGSLGKDDPAFTESTPYDPHSPYSASKAASDHLTRAWGDTYGLPVMVTNCSNNYGPYQFPEKLIPVVILKCLRGEPIPVYGKGENIRDWLYVEDHCCALVTVLEKGTPGETYNIGGNNERQNIELVRMLCSLMNKLAPKAENGNLKAEISKYADLITFVTDRPGHDMRYAINASKIRDELGWEPQEDVESGFRKTVQWYLNNKDWWEAILSGDYKLERLGKAEMRKAES